MNCFNIRPPINQSLVPVPQYRKVDKNVIFSTLLPHPPNMASSNTTSRIVELAAQINSSVTELQERLSAQSALTPSFDEDNPENLPANVVHLRDTVLDATADLHELLLNPLFLLFKFASVN